MMKKDCLILLTLMFIGQGPVTAHDGEVQISGSILENNCTVAADSQNLDVTLGNINSKIFTQAGDSSLPVSFTITLQHCGEAASSMAVSFSGVADDINSTLLAINSGGEQARGIGVAILDSNRTLIPLNTASKGYVLDPEKTENLLQFYAAYTATGSHVSSGNADATATFSLTYQ